MANDTGGAGAAGELPRFTKPVLLAWATGDKLFPLRLAERLAAMLLSATLVLVEDFYTLTRRTSPPNMPA